MPITFPASPSDGDNLDFGGYRWTYNATTGVARWIGVGYTPIVNPFADFITTTYSDTNGTTTNISLFDETPFNAQSLGPGPDGRGIAAADVATSGVIALWNGGFGQGTGILFPTGVIGPTGLLGNSVSAIVGANNAKVTFVNGEERQLQSFSTTFQENGGSFGRGGPSVSGTQVMSGAAGFTVQGSSSSDISALNIARLDFRIPAAGSGTENNTVTILVERDTLVRTLSDDQTIQQNPSSGGVSNFYNYRWGELAETFTPATAV